jgi:3'(2'), 5'-bisphosphate nucleotidase
MGSELLSEAVRIVIHAGERILEFYEEETTVEHKADLSPLTLADCAAHELICRELRRLTPQVPVLSEESAAAEIEGRHDWARFWLVDPLDGTKEFLKRTGEFTVNLALVQHGEPILGVVHVPVSRLTYFAEADGGAYRQEIGSEPRRIHTRPAHPDCLAVVASRDHAGPAVRSLLERLPGTRTLSMGSALKFCLVAEGKADLYPRDLPTMEWDTGAAQCVVEQAGGRVFDLQGQRLIYNKPSLRNPAIVTIGDPSLPWRSYLS